MIPRKYAKTTCIADSLLSNVRDISETHLALNFKMDARNLAIVFGPTLIKKKDDDMTSIVRDMSDQCRIIESVILHVSSCNKRNIWVK